MRKTAIIELVGLPGAGKTTRAQELAQERGLPIIEMPKNTGTLLAQGFLGALLRPIAASCLLMLIMKEPNPSIRRSLFINGWLGSSAKYWRARNGGIIDQGYVQALVGALPQPSDARLVACVLAGIPKRTEVVWCDTEGTIRAERLSRRSYRPREEFGEEESKRFVKESENSYLLVRSVFEGRKANRNQFRGASKFGAYIFAWVLRTLVRSFNRTSEVVVLMYHAIDRSGWKLAVTPEEFEMQMAYLAQRKWAVSLSDVVSYAKGEKKLPRRAVAVTFDDGYRDLLTDVLPILERYQIPATVFVPTDLSASTGPGERVRLSWDELRALTKSGLVEIGSHARTHRKLSALSNEEVHQELTESADDIKREIGKRPHFFAYPFGARSSSVENIAREIYAASFAITEGTIHSGDDLDRLKRVQVDATMTFLLFKLRLTAAIDWNRKIVNAMRHNRFFRFLRRVVQGEDVFMVRQSRDAWNLQFKHGSWDRLIEGQPNTARIAELVLNAKPNEGIYRVLDVGCGNGGLARLIADQVDYTGLDISGVAIDTAKSVAPAGRFIVADAERPPEDLGEFDAIVFNEVLYYMNPREVLPRYRRYATHHTRLYISVLRFWRTFFVFRRIRKHIRIERRFSVKDRSHQWDIVIGRFL